MKLKVSSPGGGTVFAAIFWNAQVISFELPDGSAGWVIMAVDGVIEIHDTFLGVPVQTIRKLNPLWS